MPTLPTAKPLPPTSRAARRRAPDAGITLVEVLVVLALMGIAAGAVGLSLGPAARGTSARAEADLLVARMRRASDEALLAGRPVALAWSDRGYRFMALEDEVWMPHPVPLLGTPKALGGEVVFVGEASGSFAVTEAALPARGAALVLELAPGGDAAGAVAVTWNGATATITDVEP